MEKIRKRKDDFKSQEQDLSGKTQMTAWKTKDKVGKLKNATLNLETEGTGKGRLVVSGVGGPKAQYRGKKAEIRKPVVQMN